MCSVGMKIEPSFELPADFELEETEHILYLMHKGENAGEFSTNSATPCAILDRCKQILQNEE